MDSVELLNRYKQLSRDDEAAIFANSVNAGQEVRVVTYYLDTAVLSTKPTPVGFSFKSFLVYDATDSATAINMRLGTQDSYQDRFEITKLTSSFKLPYAINNAYLDWTAQSGKTITIIFFKSGEMSLNRVNNSVLANNEGSSVGSPTVVTLSAATAAAILPASSSRNTAIAQNMTGADLYVGDSTVTSSGSTQGILFADRERIVWKNTAALYGYSVLGGRVITVEES